MGEPFSVAGTVVGISSLGIQTCQILHRYYSQYRGHHEDIKLVLNQVEGLQGILTGLEQVKERIERDNHDPSSQLQMALQVCKDVLKKLKAMALKCQAEKDPSDAQARIRAVLKRSAWPFKKDTLVDLRDTLSRFQDNLSLALQSAGLDAILREVGDIRPELSTLHAQNMVIRERQGHQLDTLRSVHGDIATSFEYQRWSHQEISHDLSDVQRQLSQYGESLQFITKVLVASSASPRDLSTVSPSLLSEAAHTVDAIAPAFETTLYKHKSLFHESNVRRNCSTAIAACHCRPKKRTAKKYRRWYTVFSESIYTHASDCPRFIYADYSETVAMQFIFSTRVIGACIQAGLQRSRRGGWSSIAPTLRYRAVRPDSVAFKILKSARIQIRDWERIQKGSSHSKLPQFASETFSALQVCFGKDAHPTDLDEDGNGIMKVNKSHIQEPLHILTLPVRFRLFHNAH
ncbi:hypothetical protein BKA63DRAFT_1377 [Paraphoma chrysanthemicola]|nr:hypothetical protein BKA63DRAFT_1377 [Paraphoma chrysanthemicola]